MKLKDKVLVYLKKQNKNIIITKKISKYIETLVLDTESVQLKDAYYEIKNSPKESYQTPISEIRLLQLLASSINAHKVLEIGTFKGLTAANLALVLDDDSQVITCEIDKTNYAKAKKLISKLKLQKKVHIILGNAIKTLDELIKNKEVFDLIYIDADKSGYPEYYEKSLKLTHSGSLIVLDNMLWAGLVAEETSNYSHSRILRDLNQKIFDVHGRNATIIPAWDGIVIIKVS